MRLTFALITAMLLNTPLISAQSLLSRHSTSTTKTATMTPIDSSSSPTASTRDSSGFGGEQTSPEDNQQGNHPSSKSTQTTSTSKHFRPTPDPGPPPVITPPPQIRSTLPTDVAGLNDDGSDASEGDHGNNDSANARESINSQVNPPPPPHQSSSSSSRTGTGTGTLTSTSKAAAAVQKETATTTMPSNSFESASGANGNRESTSDATVSTAEDDGVPRLIISPEILAATSGVSGHYSITIYSVLVALIAVLFLQ